MMRPGLMCPVLVIGALTVASTGGPAAAADQAEVEKVRAAAQVCYDAFSAKDIGRMAQCWWHDAYVQMLHPPDKAPHEGWEAVRKSWEPVFNYFESLTIAMENPAIHVDGRTAWIVTRERLQGRLPDGKDYTGITWATRFLEKRGDTWRTVVWHASFEPK